MQKITPNDVALAIGSSPLLIRAFIRSGSCPYGDAFLRDGKENYSYIIYPEKLVEYYGADRLREAGLDV